MDTSDPTLPILKIFKNGAWVSVHTDNSKTVELLAKTVYEQQIQLGQVAAIVEEIKEVAKTGTNPEATNTAISQAIENIDIDTSDLAKEDTLTQGISNIREDISNIDIDTSDLAKQGTNPNATLSEVQTAAEALPTLQEIVDGVIAGTTILSNLDGYTFTAGFTPRGAGDVLINRTKLYSIDDDKVEELGGTLYNAELSSLEYVRLRKATTLKVNYFARGMSLLKVLICDELLGLGNYYGFVYDAPLLEVVSLPKISSINTASHFANCPRLIDLIIGGGFISSFSLRYWSPTEALRSDTNSLVKSGETFTNNLEKLLYNIREHIAANLSSQVTATITFSSAVYAAIQADATTMAAFPASWTIASA